MFKVLLGILWAIMSLLLALTGLVGFMLIGLRVNIREVRNWIMPASMFSQNQTHKTLMIPRLVSWKLFWLTILYITDLQTILISVYLFVDWFSVYLSKISSISWWNITILLQKVDMVSWWNLFNSTCRYKCKWSFIVFVICPIALLPFLYLKFILFLMLYYYYYYFW